MIVLDTDHINVLQSGESAASTLVANMGRSADQDFTTTAITIEEQMRGWIALIHRLTDAHRQIPAYDRLVGLFRFFAHWMVLPFDERAADLFVKLRGGVLVVGSEVPNLLEPNAAATLVVSQESMWQSLSNASSP